MKKEQSWIGYVGIGTRLERNEVCTDGAAWTTRTALPIRSCLIGRSC